MTTAAKEAMNLQRVLEENRRDFAARFYALCAETLEVPWSTAVTNDLTIPSVQGERTPKRRFVMWYMERLYRAAWRDANVARALLRVVSLLDSPDRLFGFRASPGMKTRGDAIETPRTQPERSAS
jgi:hypothetical protein